MKPIPVRFDEEIFNKAKSECEKQGTTIQNELRYLVKMWSEGKYYIERGELSENR